VRPTSFLDVFRPSPRTAPGERVYAVGDVHGCSDLLAVLLERIVADNRTRSAAATHIVLLGDLINKGPDTRGVLELVAAWPHTDLPVRLLRGNHEQVLLGALSGRLDQCRQCHAMGGRATMTSYGISADQYAGWTVEELAHHLPEIIPEPHRDLLLGAALAWKSGDYIFAHAGWRDGTALADQSEADLLWTRQAYRPSARRSRTALVHGHANLAEPFNGRARICVDTTAHASGILTAVGLEGDRRWFINTSTASPRG
jgi:serine/threonine protein phosphatase 1